MHRRKTGFILFEKDCIISGKLKHSSGTLFQMKSQIAQNWSTSNILHIKSLRLSSTEKELSRTILKNNEVTFSASD